jgi:hypothetical protein
MGPYTCGRGSIVVKLEEFLNLPANLADLRIRLAGHQKASMILATILNLNAEERKHLLDDYFPPTAEGNGRFACYSEGFLIAVDAALDKAASYHVGIDWGCGQYDACITNWEDRPTLRLIHVRVMSNFPPSSLVPINTDGTTQKESGPPNPGDARGVFLVAASGAGNKTWDLTTDPQMGDGRLP